MDNVNVNEVEVQNEEILDNQDEKPIEKEVFYKDENGNYVLNLSKELKYGEQNIKSLVILAIKKAKDFRAIGDILIAHMSANKISKTSDLLAKLDRNLFDKLWRHLVRFNDEPLLISAIGELEILD